MTNGSPTLPAPEQIVLIHYLHPVGPRRQNPVPSHVEVGRMIQMTADPGTGVPTEFYRLVGPRRSRKVQRANYDHYLSIIRSDRMDGTWLVEQLHAAAEEHAVAAAAAKEEYDRCVQEKLEVWRAPKLRNAWKALETKPFTPEQIGDLMDQARRRYLAAR